MRQAVGLLIHLWHVALLLIAILGDSRNRCRPTRPDVDRLAREPRVVPAYPTPDGMTPDATIAPQCPMPIWQPNPDIRYAALVLQVRPAADDVPPAGVVCVNRYGRSTAYP